MILTAFPIFDNRHPSPQGCRWANRFALLLFTVTVFVGLAIKYA